LSDYCKLAIAAGIASNSRSTADKQAIYEWFVKKLTACDAELFKALGIVQYRQPNTLIKQVPLDASPLANGGKMIIRETKQVSVQIVGNYDQVHFEHHGTA
jgi:hypothetical protein